MHLPEDTEKFRQNLKFVIEIKCRVFITKKAAYLNFKQNVRTFQINFEFLYLQEIVKHYFNKHN